MFELRVRSRGQVTTQLSRYFHSSAQQRAKNAKCGDETSFFFLFNFWVSVPRFLPRFDRHFMLRYSPQEGTYMTYHDVFWSFSSSSSCKWSSKPVFLLYLRLGNVLEITASEFDIYSSPRNDENDYFGAGMCQKRLSKNWVADRKVLSHIDKVGDTSPSKLQWKF